MKVLTIEEVKDCIAIPGTMGETLQNLAQIKYDQALTAGVTEPEAAKVALDYIREKLLEFSKGI